MATSAVRASTAVMAVVLGGGNDPDRCPRQELTDGGTAVTDYYAGWQQCRRQTPGDRQSPGGFSASGGKHGGGSVM